MEEKEIKELLENVKGQVNSIIEEKNKGLLPKEEFSTAIKELSDKLEGIEEKADNTEIKEAVDKALKEIELLKTSEKSDIIHNSRESAVKSAVDGLVNSEEYNEWVDEGCKGEGPKMTVKYSIASDRTGSVLISNQSNLVQDPHYMRTLYMRDVLPTGSIEQHYLVFDKVTEFTRPALGIGENDDALEVTMKTAESTTDVKRIATFIDVSKRAAKAVKWLTGHLSRRMPEDIKEQEDFQVLFGDGAGNNLDGLFKQATLLDLTGNSFIAGAVASVATYNGGTQTIVNFAAAHGLNNGLKITFADATATGYNNPFSVNVRTDKSILIDTAYVAEADTSAWTATTAYGNKNAIDNATEIDVLNATKAVMKVGRYMVTAHVINPIDASIIESLKDTTAQYIAGKAERVNGVLFIDGIPCIETDAMKQGWGMSMDSRNIAELLEFTSLSVYSMTDATLEKANKVRFFANEEVMLPVYNPFLATYYNFATVKTALETA